MRRRYRRYAFYQTEMSKARLKFTIQDYTLMVQGLCACDRVHEAAREIEEMKSQAIGSFGRKEANEAYCQRVLKHMVKDKDNLEAEHQHLLKIKSILGSEDAA